MVRGEGMKGAPGSMDSFARNHPVAFALTLAVAWSVLLVVFLGVASSALRMSYGDATVGAIGRLAVTACVLLLVWHLGWLKAAGITRLGRWQVWLLAIGGLVYFAGASLYALYGQVPSDVLGLMRLPGALHLTHVFTFGAELPSALILTLQTCVVALWWGALVAVQGLSVPMVEPGILAYTRLLWFSLPLGALGILMLLRAGPDCVPCEHP